MLISLSNKSGFKVIQIVLCVVTYLMLLYIYEFVAKSLQRSLSEQRNLIMRDLSERHGVTFPQCGTV